MRNKKNFILWVLVLLAFIFSLNFFPAASSRIKESFFSFIFPLQRLMLNSGNTFFQRLEVFKNTEEIREEIHFLRSENRKLTSNISKYREIEDENKALREALDVDFPEEKKMIFAEIAGRNIADHYIVLRHREDVAENYPVITPEGILIGLIEETYGEFSKIKLLTSPESVIEVKVQNEDNPIGVLSGNNRRSLLLDFLPRDKTVEAGDMVVGLLKEGTPIGGLYVGRITQVIDNDVEAFIQAEVFQGIDLRGLRYLFIIN